MPWIQLEPDGPGDPMVQHINPDPDGFTIRTEFLDTQAVLDQNTAVRNERGSQIDPHHHYVATIPEEVQLIWDREFPEWRRDNEIFARLLRDRDWCKVRTSEKY